MVAAQKLHSSSERCWRFGPIWARSTHPIGVDGIPVGFWEVAITFRIVNDRYPLVDGFQGTLHGLIEVPANQMVASYTSVRANTSHATGLAA
jgi:hypothetical protein